MSPCAVLEPMVREGRLGKKSARGFYDYTVKGPGDKSRIASDLARFRSEDAPRLPALTEEEIVDRAVLAMLNEAARALEEEVVIGPRELDLATVFGMGFPPFRGGILCYADTVGVHAVIEKLSRIAAAPDVASRTGGPERFTPADSLAAMARNLRRFHA